MTPMRQKTYIAQRLSRTSFIGLTVLIAAIQLYPTPPASASKWVWLVLSVLPLLAFARGVLRQQPRSVMLAALISLLYFCHAVVDLMGKPANPQGAGVELSLSVLLFVSGVLYARWRSEELADTAVKAE